MRRQYDVVSALDVCVDFIVTGKDTRPEYSQTEKLIDDYAIEIGGSACIFACQAAKLGLKTAGVGVFGNDLFGRFVWDRLLSAGIDLSGSKTADEIKTAVGIALTEENDRAILTYLGTIAAEGLEKALEEYITKTRHLHIGSYFIMNGIRPHYYNLACKAKKQGVTVSLDTNWDPEERWDGGLLRLLPMVDVFFPNENEITRIAGIESIGEAAASLCGNAGLVVVKKGGNGASVYDGTGLAADLGAIPVDVTDTIGAGDSFDAGFLFSYLNGKSMDECLASAIYCGSMSARGRGGISAQVRLPDLHEYMAAKGTRP